MRNIRCLALVTGIAALSAVAFTPKAQAQTANIDFTGNVAATCIINNTTPGTLALNTLRTLLADATNGTPGNINVSCNSGTTFTITGVTNNGSNITGGTYNADVDGAFATIRDISAATTVAQGNVSPSGGSAIPAGTAPGTAGAVQSGPITNKNYAVDLSVFKIGTNSQLKAGTYNVRVGVSLAPQ